MSTELDTPQIPKQKTGLDRALAQRLVDDYLRLLVLDDAEGIGALYHPEARLEDPVGSTPLIGRKAIVGFYSNGLSGIDAAELSGPIRVAGNEVAFAFNLHMKIKGQSFAMDIIDVFVIEAEQVVSMRAFWSRENMRPV
jgi:steroid delta-isomerase